MGYSVYEDQDTDRWAGYGVPAQCDWPDCETKIDRGLGYKCENHGHFEERRVGMIYSSQSAREAAQFEEDWVDAEGCGLFFCPTHLAKTDEHDDVQPKGESLEWIRHILTHDSWAQWRAENPAKVAEYREALERSQRDLV